ncbi:MAG: type I-E CRISPR-associated protein Cse1/CasA, partial [Azospira oryzae]
MYHLLDDPLIGVRTPQGERRLTLPEMLAALSSGHIDGYSGLRAHQADPWHVFLVQLAASIQARRPTERLPAETTYWRDGLLDLAEGQSTAWELVVDDVTKPAFLQHPW